MLIALFNTDYEKDCNIFSLLGDGIVLLRKACS